jgi:FkbM family methyltransferase
MLGRALYPAFRRVDFRGKGRLRSRLPVPQEGRPVVTFPGGFRLRLDLRESLQRDFYFGLYDRHELRLVADRLDTGGDFVDVGAHVGMYALRAAVALGTRGRVLAFEPNPAARAQLEENVALNERGNIVVRSTAAAASPGRATLHVPATADPSFSSLEGGRFAEGAPLEIETETIDDVVAQTGLRPAVIKIDVEGGELDVLRGARRTIAEHRPAVLVEVSEHTAAAVAEELTGHRGSLVSRRRLEPLSAGRGLFNAWFVPI